MGLGFVWFFGLMVLFLLETPRGGLQNDSAVDILEVKTTRNNSQDVETVSDASSEGFTYLDSTEDA